VEEDDDIQREDVVENNIYFVDIFYSIFIIIKVVIKIE
jgi:hypothetical protein